MRKSLSLVLFLFPLITYAQFRISGRILDTANNKPIAGVSIFVTNTTIGVATKPDGTFVLTNVKSGEYEIIVSAVGHQVQTRNILLYHDVTLPDIHLKQHALALSEVNIRPTAFNQKYYDAFKAIFLGTDRDAKHCKILNPEILNFYYEGHEITARSDGLLIIDNKELGYRIKYLVKNFSLDSVTMTFSYKGSAVFSPMKGSPGQVRTWLRNRRDVYNGSMMQFLRSCASNKLKPAGFKVVSFTRRVTKNAAGDSINLVGMNQKIRSYNRRIKYLGLQADLRPGDSGRLHDSVMLVVDSLRKLTDSIRVNKLADYVGKDSIGAAEIVKRTGIDGIYDLALNGEVFVFYTKKYDANTNGVHIPDGMPKYQTTVLTRKADDILFNQNGVLLDTESLLTEGKWAGQRVAETLPFDYNPEAPN
jgi:hypothetical protein